MIHNYEKCKNSILSSKSPIELHHNGFVSINKDYILDTIKTLIKKNQEFILFTDEYGWTFENRTLFWSTF